MELFYTPVLICEKDGTVCARNSSATRFFNRPRKGDDVCSYLDGRSINDYLSIISGQTDTAVMIMMCGNALCGLFTVSGVTRTVFIFLPLLQNDTSNGFYSFYSDIAVSSGRSIIDIFMRCFACDSEKTSSRDKLYYSKLRRIEEEYKKLIYDIILTSTKAPHSNIGMHQVYEVVTAVANSFNQRLPRIGIRFKCTASGFNLYSPLYIPPIEFVVVLSELIVLGASLSLRQECAVDISSSCLMLTAEISVCADIELLALRDDMPLIELGEIKPANILSFAAALGIAERLGWNCEYKIYKRRRDNLHLILSLQMTDDCIEQLRDPDHSAYERMVFNDGIDGYISMIIDS